MANSKTTLVGRPRMFGASEAAVGTARCISYNRGEVRRAVDQCVGELPDLQDQFLRAQGVLLKPNLLSSRSGPEDHVNTHPAVIGALAELLIGEFGCQVAIGDSCGTLSGGSTARAISNSRMDEVAARVGARLYNVDAQPRHVAAFEQGRIFREIPLPSNLEQFDLIVSVAKLKTHNLTCTTGAVKNMLGIVPGAGKKQAHLMAPSPEEFAELLCDLYEAVRPRAAFVDGVVGMEGRGPAHGSLRHVELIAASCDPVALDSFCAEVMGFDPMSVPLLRRCQKRGLGTCSPRSIVVRGEPASAFGGEDFARPPTYSSRLALKILPRWLFRRALGAFATRYAAIDQDRCKRCGECAVNCPSHAISRHDRTLRYGVDRRRCICCYCCAEVCPHDAVLIQETRVKRFWRRLRALLRPQVASAR